MKLPYKKKLKIVTSPARFNNDFSITLESQIKNEKDISSPRDSVPVRLIVVQGWVEKAEDKNTNI
jgi:hypothetical protein